MKATIQRKIIHVDFDAFFANVEVTDNPNLHGKAVAVGGKPENRGVISTCNYEARKYGVHSAMPSSLALKLCPNLQILPGRFERYKTISQAAQKIFYKYTNLVEPLSLDEAYLDVTNSNWYSGSATLIAHNIRREIYDTLNLTVSAGVSANMFLAKIASDWNKPDGLFIIHPKDITNFLEKLPVEKLHGVGKITANKLHKQNILTCGQLKTLSLTILKEQFGTFGTKMWNLCRGKDDREVTPNRIRKSISVEQTFPKDINSIKELIAKLTELYQQLQIRIANSKIKYLPTKRFIKIKFSNYEIAQHIEDLNHLKDQQHFIRLLKITLGDKFLPVRLLGIGIKIVDLSTTSYQQLQMDLN